MAIKHFCDRCEKQKLGKELTEARFCVDSLIKEDGRYCEDCLETIEQTIKEVMGVLK